MPCEYFKNALVEAAATGAAPQGELRAHLETCESCRAAFAQEQSLFQAIDSGLPAAVNADVPPSLLPRVRASLDDAAAARSRWFVSWPVLASAAVSVAVLFAVVVLRQNHIARNPENSVVSNPSSPLASVSPELRDSSTQAVPPSVSARSHFSVARNSTSRSTLERHTPQPEVLVPRNQELLLASYAQQWGARKRAPLLAANLDDTTVTPLEVDPIQIDQLDVKPLVEGNSQ